MLNTIKKYWKHGILVLIIGTSFSSGEIYNRTITNTLENTKEHPAWNTTILTAEKALKEMDKKGR